MDGFEEMYAWYDTTVAFDLIWNEIPATEHDSAPPTDIRHVLWLKLKCMSLGMPRPDIKKLFNSHRPDIDILEAYVNSFKLKPGDK